jgi:glycosyltransferase involved in cell wall biosynthesis
MCRLMTKAPVISIIIPTKDSETTIDRCLKSVKNQTYSNIEVIVVDGFSKDGTRKIAEGHGVKILESGARRSKARNIGAEKARGRFLLFVDSDMELDSCVVDECVEKIKEGYNGVIIPEISVGEGFWAKCKALEKACYAGDDSIEAARFFRKSVFDRLGGYDPELEAGEDWDLNERISEVWGNVGRIRSLIIHHEGRLSLRATMLKKHHYGKTLKRYRMKHPKKAKQQLTLLRFGFVKNWRGLVKNPLYMLGLFLMKTCEFAAVELSVLAIP